MTVSGTGLLALPDPAIYTATATDPRSGSGSISIIWNRAADWRRLKMLVLDSVSSAITKRFYNFNQR